MLTYRAARILWRQGRQAHASGLPQLPTPYRPGSEIESEYLAGWGDAEVDRTVAMKTQSRVAKLTVAGPRPV